MASPGSMQFIDVHTHILPGIDDGARDLAESLLILKEAVQSGVKEIILTPHHSYHADFDLGRVLQEFESFKQAVLHERIPVTLHLGHEIMAAPELPGLIKTDKRLTINGRGKFILIEVPTFEMPMYTAGVFFGIMAQGVTPVWAHPERCFDVLKHEQILKDFMASGGMLQINAGSLLGKYGRSARASALALLKKGYCHIVASDIHRSGEINRLLPEAFLFLKKAVGSQKAEDMVFTMPSKLIA